MSLKYDPASEPLHISVQGSPATIESSHFDDFPLQRQKGTT